MEENRIDEEQAKFASVLIPLKTWLSRRWGKKYLRKHCWLRGKISGKIKMYTLNKRLKEYSKT